MCWHVSASLAHALPGYSLMCRALYTFQRNQLAWPHHLPSELASDGVRFADARGSVGRRVRSMTKVRLKWHGGVIVLLQQRPKHPREMVITPKASTSNRMMCLFVFSLPGYTVRETAESGSGGRVPQSTISIYIAYVHVQLVSAVLCAEVCIDLCICLGLILHVLSGSSA